MIKLILPTHSKTYDKNAGITVYFKGNLYINNELQQAENLIKLSSLLIKNLSDIKELKKILLSFSGNFSVVIATKNNSILVITDKVRSIPIFYCYLLNELIVGEKFDDISNFLSSKSIDIVSSISYLLSGFVVGNKTLYNEIKQLNAGQFLIFSLHELQVKNYFTYRYQGNNFLSLKEYCKNFDHVLEETFTKTINSLRYRNVVIPLSGGLDSRLIAVMFKEYGYENVLTYTYGKINNQEAQVSKKIAKLLGYPWLIIPYSNNLWYSIYHSTIMTKYMHFANCYASLPHIQDFPAVMELSLEKKIPEDSIFVPGHSLDLLAGSWIKPEWILKSNFSLNDAINCILKDHFALFYWDVYSNKWLDIIKGEINDNMLDVSVSSKEDELSIIENWNWKERQSKFIINSLRVYEFWNYDWRIPLWDESFIDFFVKLPLYWRFNKLFYKYYLSNRFQKLFWDIDISRVTPTNHYKQIKELKENIKYNKMFRKPLRHAFTTYEYFSHPFSWYGINNFRDHWTKISKDKLTATKINSFTARDIIENIYTQNKLNYKIIFDINNGEILL